MKKFLIVVIAAWINLVSFGQEAEDALFNDTVPLDIAFSISIRSVRNSPDSVYLKEMMTYRTGNGGTDSIKVGFKRRGNFRLNECVFPPLWMKIGKKKNKNTPFEGHTKLKLVMPCDGGKGSNDLILREYLCYRLYEVMTPFCFRTRLVNIDFTDDKGKKKNVYQLKGILVEDVDEIVKRTAAKKASAARINSKFLNDTCALRFDLFQLLISNTDWSKASQHNSKLITRDGKYIPLPYDFDMSGVVNAPYSVVSQVGDDKLPIEHVTERYYRGFCASKETTDFVRREFLVNEAKLLAVPGELKGSLPDKEINRLVEYLEEFFLILKNENLFYIKVVEMCRPL